MTFTAILPLGGVSKGRETVLYRLAQASASMSAFSAVSSRFSGSLPPVR